jgi:hypothetical protein
MSRLVPRAESISMLRAEPWPQWLLELELLGLAAPALELATIAVPLAVQV